MPVAPDVLEAFQRLAAVSGMSTGRAMGEWLADTMDGVTMMTDLLEKAKQAPKLAARELHAYAKGLTGLTSELIEEVRAKSAGALVREGAPRQRVPHAPTPPQKGVSGRSSMRRKSGSRSPLPPVSNTGEKSPKKSQKGRVNPYENHYRLVEV